jgi:surface polysaccharide O-acyltransferase-like enzyme
LSQRIYYLDSLKVLAIFAVVLIHTASTPLYTTTPDDTLFVYANFLDSLSRFCVPLFFMASGAAILGRDYGIVDFYRKRLTKIIPVLVFWALVYLAFRVFVKGEHIGVLQAAMMFFGGHVYYHLWFLYVIVILYLLSPFMRRLVVSMSRQEALVLFGVWAMVAVVLPHAESVSGLRFGFVYKEFGAYSGYFVLGYYLSRAEFKKPLVSLVVFAASSLAIFYLTGLLSAAKGELVGTFYDYSSPLVFLQGVSMFLLFKSFERAKSFEYLAKLAPLVFGVYLLHPLVLEYSSFVDDLTLKALFVFTSSLILVKALCTAGFRRIL